MFPLDPGQALDRFVVTHLTHYVERRQAVTRALWQGREKRGDRGVVAKGLATMGETVKVARAENKASPQLERVLAQFVLRMPGGFGARAIMGIVPSQQMEQVGALELHGVVGFSLFVNQ